MRHSFSRRNPIIPEFSAIEVTSPLAIPTVKLKDQYYGDWDKKLQDFITKANEDTSMPRTMYMLRLSWPRRNGVTVIGDCSLAFAGEGVNVAIWQAVLFG